MPNANSNSVAASNGANVPVLTATNVATANAAVNVLNKEKGYNMMYMIIMIVVILAAVLVYQWSQAGQKAFEAKIGMGEMADSEDFYMH